MRLLIWDFDDTLFPTSHFRRFPASRSSPATKLKFTQFDADFVQILTVPGTSHMILTAATSSWVRQQMVLFLPRTAAFLDTLLPLVSTGDARWHDRFAQGKYEILKPHLGGYQYRHVLSLGDGPNEALAMRRWRQERPDMDITHVRCLSELPVSHFFLQLHRLLAYTKQWLRT